MPIIKADPKDPDLPEWLKDALFRKARRETGCLPHLLNMGMEEARGLVAQLTAEEVNKLGKETTDIMQTNCEFPYGIIGRTKDGQLAYYGLNHMGAASLEDLQKNAGHMITEGAEASDRNSGRKLNAAIEAYLRNEEGLSPLN